MAISQKSLATMLVSLKIFPDEAAATRAITEQQEHQIALPDGTEIMTKEDKDTFGKNKYDTGATAGAEMLLKKIVEKDLPEFSGNKKDSEAIVAALVEKGNKSAGAPTDEKLKERDKTIGTLRDTIKTMEQQSKDFEAKMQKRDREAQLLTWTIEKKPDNFTNEEWLQIISMSNELVEDEGKLFVKRGGEVVKDKLQSPIAAKDAVLAWIDERKIGKVVAANGNGSPAGRGGEDSKLNTNGIRTMSQFTAYCEQNKIDVKSAKASAELARISGENKDFDFAN